MSWLENFGKNNYRGGRLLGTKEYSLKLNNRGYNNMGVELLLKCINWETVNSWGVNA